MFLKISLETVHWPPAVAALLCAVRLWAAAAIGWVWMGSAFGGARVQTDVALGGGLKPTLRGID